MTRPLVCYARVRSFMLGDAGVGSITEGLVTPPSGTTPQMMRALNHRIVFRCIQACGKVSRADLARRIGLSKPTISLVVGDLQRAGLVRVAGHRLPTGLGKSSLLFEPDPTAGYVLGIGVGRHWVRTGIADFSGDLLARHDVPNHSGGTAGLVSLVSSAVAHVQASAGLTQERIVATVLGGPGVLDYRTRRFVYAPNLPGWSRPGVLDALEASMKREIYFDNDVALATIAEAALGAGRGFTTFVYLWIGTGVGARLWLHGQLYRGATGTAGEIGFLPLSPSTGMDNTPALAVERRHGRTERNVTAGAMLRSARRFGIRNCDEATELFEMAGAGEPRAIRVIEQEGRRVAHLLAAIVALLDPGLVLFGGSIGHHLGQMADVLNRELRQLSPLRPHIATARFADDAVLLGAVTAALGRAREQVFDESMRRIGAQVVPLNMSRDSRLDGAVPSSTGPARSSIDALEGLGGPNG